MFLLALSSGSYRGSVCTDDEQRAAQVPVTERQLLPDLRVCAHCFCFFVCPLHICQHQQNLPESTRATPAPSSRPGSAHTRPLSAQQRTETKAPQSATLHAAAGKGNVNLIKDLIAGGADLSGLDRFGSSALHYAAGGGHEGVVRFLLLHGASANARSRYVSLQYRPLSLSIHHPPLCLCFF